MKRNLAVDSVTKREREKEILVIFPNLICCVFQIYFIFRSFHGILFFHFQLKFLRAFLMFLSQFHELCFYSSVGVLWQYRISWTKGFYLKPGRNPRTLEPIISLDFSATSVILFFKKKKMATLLLKSTSSTLCWVLVQHYSSIFVIIRHNYQYYVMFFRTEI